MVSSQASGAKVARVFSALWLCLGLATGVAHAQSAPESRAAAEPSYGAQIVLMDLGSVLGGGLLAAATDSPKPLLLGAVGWSMGGPAIHIIHGRPGRGALSFLLHLGLPILGGFTGAALASCPASHGTDDTDPFCGAGEVLTFGFLGMAAATIIDAAVLAQPGDEPSRAAPQGRGPSSAPALSLTRDGELTVGWRGTF